MFLAKGYTTTPVAASSKVAVTVAEEKSASANGSTKTAYTN